MPQLPMHVWVTYHVTYHTAAPAIREAAVTVDTVEAVARPAGKAEVMDDVKTDGPPADAVKSSDSAQVGSNANDAPADQMFPGRVIVAIGDIALDRWPLLHSDRQRSFPANNPAASAQKIIAPSSMVSRRHSATNSDRQRSSLQHVSRPPLFSIDIIIADVSTVSSSVSSNTAATATAAAAPRVLASKVCHSSCQWSRDRSTYVAHMLPLSQSSRVLSSLADCIASVLEPVQQHEQSDGSSEVSAHRVLVYQSYDLGGSFNPSSPAFDPQDLVGLKCEVMLSSDLSTGT